MSRRHLKGGSTKIIDIVFMLLLLPRYIEVSSAHNSNKTHTNQNANDTSPVTFSEPNCGGLLWVGIEAKNFSIPQSKMGKPMKCRWLLKTPNRKQRVGLTTLDTNLTLGRRDCFSLQSRDGWKENASLLGSFSICNESFVAWDWQFEMTIVSSTNYMLVEYSNNGNNPLVMQLLYYTCGGEAESDTYISSPIFSPKYSIAQIVECTWNFTKPPNALYGCIKLLNVSISDTSVLQVCSSGEMRNFNFQYLDDNLHNTSGKVISNISKPIETESEITFKTLRESENARGNSSLLCTHKLPGGRGESQSIVGNTFNVIVFDGTTVLLVYRIQEPKSGTGFNARYFPVLLPKREESVPVPWYINYSGVTIYMPIGVFLGMLIILLQLRKRGPSRAAMKSVGSAILNGNAAPQSRVALTPKCLDFVLQDSEKRRSAGVTCSFALQALEGLQMVAPQSEREPLIKPKVKLKEELSVVVTCHEKESNGNISTKSVAARRRSGSTTDLISIDHNSNDRTKRTRRAAFKNTSTLDGSRTL